jgi:hypothetical protein
MRTDLDEFRDLGPRWKNLVTGEIHAIAPRLGELDWIACEQSTLCMR